MKPRSSSKKSAIYSIVTVLLVAGLLVYAFRTVGHRSHSPAKSDGSVSLQGVSRPASAEGAAKWQEAYAALPLSFEQNQGQATDAIHYMAHGSDYTVALTSQETIFSLQSVEPNKNTKDATRASAIAALQGRQKISTSTLRLKLHESNPAPEIAGVDRLPGKTDYFVGNDPKKWHTDIPSYGRVKYTGVYPGVDLVYYGNHRTLEYDFVVAPGADPKAIRFDVNGAKTVRLNSHGDLVLKTANGGVTVQKPVVYQTIAGKRQEVASGYAISKDRQVSFEVGEYNHSEPLTLDPVVTLLQYGTYLGGAGAGAASQTAYAIALDSASPPNAYVTGTTSAVAPGAFPTTAGADNATGDVAGAVFVTEINPTGTALVYSSYISGTTQTGADTGYGIAVDSTGKIYVAGRTFATDFPTTANALKQGPNASNTTGTSFLSKLDPTLSGAASLVYSSYLGGTTAADGNPDTASAVATDPTTAGIVYITGITASGPGATLATFPVSANAFQATQSAGGAAGGEAFLTAINTTLSGAASLVYSTYLGGNGANALAGPGYSEWGFGVAADIAHNAYVTGQTTSTNFPTTASAYQTTAPAAVAAGTGFVTRLNTTALTGPASEVYSTYLGGENTTFGDFPTAIALDGNIAYVTGQTSSLMYPIFPVAGAYQTTGNAPQGAGFLTLVNTAGSGGTSVTYSTYFGPGSTLPLAIHVDTGGNAYIAGNEGSNTLPVTAGAFEQTFIAGAKGMGFFAKLNPVGGGASDLVYSSYFGGAGTAAAGDQVRGISVDSSGNVYLTGLTQSAPASAFPFSAGAFQTTLKGTQDGYVAKIALTPTNLTLTPASGGTLAFGTQTEGVTSGAQAVTITNNGYQPLTFTANPSIVAGAPAASGTDFKINAGGTTCATATPIAANGGTCTVSVVYDPSVLGAESATINFGNADTSPQVINLSGTGAIAANPVPTITAPLVPASVNAGSGGFTLTVNGTNFINSSVVNFGVAAETTTFVSATQLTATIPAAAVLLGGSPAVTVTNPAPGGGTSNPVAFAINNPAPTVTSLLPTSVLMGAAQFTLTVNGTNFVSASVVNFNGAAETTTFVSATQLTATIPAAAVATAGSFPVTVTNAAPGGGISTVSAASTFAVNNPVPTITTLVPAHLAAGVGFTLTVNGTNFVPTSAVKFNNLAVATTFVNATQLTAVIPAADTATGGSISVTVTNGTPGGGTTAATTFTLDDFTVSGPTSPVTVIRGGAMVPINISLTPTTANGFPNAVLFTVSGFATGLSGQFTQTSLTPGTSIVSTTLTINPGTAAAVPTHRSPRFPTIPLGLLMTLAAASLLFLQRARWVNLVPARAALVLWLVLFSGVGVMLSGCSGSGGFQGPTAGDVITVTATSGTDVHNFAITLNVQQ